MTFPEPRQCEATTDAMIFGVVRCHCPHNHPGPHYSIQDTERHGRVLLTWRSETSGFVSIPLVTPADPMTAQN